MRIWQEIRIIFISLSVIVFFLATISSLDHPESNLLLLVASPKHNIMHFPFTAADVTRMQYFLKDFFVFTMHVPLTCCDNISATYIALNPIIHSRTKHV